MASRVTLAGVCVLVVFAPLAFGAVETWARTVIIGGTALLAVAGLVTAAAAGCLRFRRTLLYVPLFGFLGWVTLQLVLGHSMYRHATREELLWAACLAMAWLLVMNGLNAQQLRRLPVCLSVWGFMLAVFGVLQGLAAPHDTIYLFQSLPEGPTAYGPFVNKNHYAGYMELLAPMPLAMVAYGAVRREQRALFLFMGLVMMLSVALSFSRAGIIVAALQCSILLTRTRRRPAHIAAAAALVMVCAGSVLAMGGRPLLTRLATLSEFSREPSIAVRWQVTRDAAFIVGDHAIWGTGLATFGDVFPRYKSFDDGLQWEHAHNDWIQLAAETGVTGAGLALAFLAGLIGMWRSAAARGGAPLETCDRAVVAGVALGCSGLLVHALADFQFRIPATALAFAVLYGLGCALQGPSVIRGRAA